MPQVRRNIKLHMMVELMKGLRYKGHCYRKGSFALAAVELCRVSWENGEW